jgi:hypothetical protein
VPLPSVPSQACFPLNLWASRIARVTVYPGSATVERVAKVPAGARSITLACLPASLDAQSLQIHADSAVRVGEFNVRTEDRDVVAGLRQPAGRPHPRAGRPDRRREGRGASLQLVDGYLKIRGDRQALRPKRTRPPASLPTPAQIAATADVLRKSAQDIQGPRAPVAAQARGAGTGPQTPAGRARAHRQPARAGGVGHREPGRRPRRPSCA